MPSPSPEPRLPWTGPACCTRPKLAPVCRPNLACRQTIPMPLIQPVVPDKCDNPDLMDKPMLNVTTRLTNRSFKIKLVDKITQIWWIKKPLKMAKLKVPVLLAQIWVQSHSKSLRGVINLQHCVNNQHILPLLNRVRLITAQKPAKEITYAFIQLP